MSCSDRKTYTDVINYRCLNILNICLDMYQILKVLCQYLGANVISHKHCSLLSILNAIALQKHDSSAWQITVFAPKKEKEKNTNIKICVRTWNGNQDHLNRSLMRNLSDTTTTEHIHIVQLSNSYKVVHRTINELTRIYGPHFSRILGF